MTKLDIGIDENARHAVADALNATLADTYSLYMKTHAYHWNVTGPQFHTLHVLFEEQYREMWAALDEIAERVRALGVFAPTSGKQFADLSAIENADTTPPSAEEMVKRLLTDHETLIKRARNGLETA
ncbi:MAG: DNA starvation/stationary phase protection protein, partial [Pseudomonadota bacterium]